MNKIICRTKSKDRFEKMRSRYLGAINKKHPETGFTGQRPSEYISWGFNHRIIYNYIEPAIRDCLPIVESALVINDFTFDMINFLIEKNVERITAMFVVADEQDKKNIQEWIEDYFIGINQLNIVYLTETTDYLSNGSYKNGKSKKYIAVKNWNLTELTSMKFDLIIANPPYGKIGANITKKIIDNVEFDEYINLFPANDYKRNDSKDLYNYQSGMEPIPNGFADAAVTTHLAKIHKTKVNNMTTDEFERSQYIDRQLDKYFEENSKRKHYAIDKIPGAGQTLKKLSPWPTSKTFIIAMRDMNHRSMGGKNSATYKWNVDESIDFEYITKNYNTRDNRLFIAQCVFDTNIEKSNFVKFIYFGNEARFVQKLFTAINCDGTIKQNIFPKVDWTRSWTVEEILADYGYTEDEIKEVIEDLKNYKGLEN